MIHWKVVPTIFHNDHISQGLCKIVKTTVQCIVVLQLRGEGPGNLSHSSPTFWDILPAIGEQQYIEM